MVQHLQSILRPFISLQMP